MYKFDAARAADLICREKLLSAGGVPNLVAQILDEIDRQGRWNEVVLEGISYGGGPPSSKLPAVTKQRIPNAMAGQGYGLTGESVCLLSPVLQVGAVLLTRSGPTQRSTRSPRRLSVTTTSSVSLAHTLSGRANNPDHGLFMQVLLLVARRRPSSRSRSSTPIRNALSRNKRLTRPARLAKCASSVRTSRKGIGETRPPPGKRSTRTAGSARGHPTCSPLQDNFVVSDA